MDGIPPALPTDSEDIAWALETADALWRRGERVDAVVWVRRAAQAAGEGEDAKRAAALARSAAELGDWIGSHTISGESTDTHTPSDRSIEAIDALLGPPPGSDGLDIVVLSTNDVEVVSARDFEAGFAPPKPPPLVSGPPKLPQPVVSGPPRLPQPRQPSAPSAPSDGEIMTVSLHAPDVEIVENEAVEEFGEEEPTPVLRHPRSPVPEPNVPSAAQAHAGILDPWTEAAAARQSVERASSGGGMRAFEEDEVVTSAKRNAAQVPRADDAADAIVPRAPKAPRIPGPSAPKARPAAPPTAEEPETTTYRQINARSSRAGDRPHEPSAAAPAAPPETKVPPKGPLGRARPTAPAKAPPAKPEPPRAKPEARTPEPPPEPIPPTKPATLPKAVSAPPALDLLEMVDSVSLESEPAPPKPEPRVSTPASARPTAPPPSSMPHGAIPTGAPVGATAAPDGPTASSDRPTGAPDGTGASSDRPTGAPAGSTPVPDRPTGAPTRPHGGQTLLDLGGVEALSDLPDDAREAFGLAATMHAIATNEEVSSFALALVVEGEIDVSATIVDAPALRLERNSILRSRGTIVPGVGLRLVCASPKALVATWDDAAVAAAFRTCPWVEEDLRVVTDRVQAKAGVTMGPLGDRFDQSLREHFTSKLTVRNLAPGEVLVAQGKPAPIAIVGIGEIVLTKNGERTEALGPGDFVFPAQTLAHAPAPATAAAGPAGAVVLYGDRAVAQELLMSFPPLLEVLATL